MILAGRDGAVQELRRVDRSRQPGAPDRHAVEVLVVERAEIGQLDERRDRRQALVGRTELEAFDLCRFGVERRARELLGDRQGGVARPRFELLVPEAVARART